MMLTISAYRIEENNTLHLHGMQKNRSGVWQEYDFTIWGDWYKPTEDGSYATAEYYHFWPDYTKSVRSCKKWQIQDNRLEILNFIPVRDDSKLKIGETI